MKVPVMKTLSAAIIILLVSFTARADKPELIVQRGHSAHIRAIAVSPDGKILASGSSSPEQVIKLWEVDTGVEFRTLTGHTDSVVSLAFSPDGKILASGSYDTTIKLWDVLTGAELQTLKGHTNIVVSIAFSPDGKRLVSGGPDGMIRVWNLKTAKAALSFKGHSQEDVNSVVFSPDGKTLASGGDDHLAKLWDAKTWAELRVFKGHISPVYAVAFSPDGRILATGGGTNPAGLLMQSIDPSLKPDGEDMTIRLWDVASATQLRTLTGHTREVTSVAFSPDGKTLLSGASSGDVPKLWDVSGGTELRSLQGESNWASAVAFHPHGKYLFSSDEHAGRDRVVHMYDAGTGNQLRTFKGRAHYLQDLAFSPDGKTLAIASGDQSLKLWDLTTGRPRDAFQGLPSWVSAIAFSPNGETVVVRGSGDKVGSWDVNSGKELNTFRAFTMNKFKDSFSPDGKFLAGTFYRKSDSNTGYVGDTLVGLWEVKTGIQRHTLSHNSRDESLLAFSRDSQLLAAGSDDGTITLWNVQTGNVARTFKGNENVKRVAFSPDGRFLASVRGDRFQDVLEIWDTATDSAPLRMIDPDPYFISSPLVFSPDGRFLVAGNQQLIKLWEAKTGQLKATFSGHTNRVGSLAFSPDGRRLASGSSDGSIKIWQFPDGKELATLISFDERDWAVVTQEGRFDASDGGQALMHWRIGNESVALQQLKEGFFEPRLLAKVMGLNPEPLRNISGFTDVKLFPRVEYEPPPPGGRQLDIHLTNRGGGIGPVQVLVNGKEVVADARPANFNPNAAQATLRVDLTAAHLIEGRPNSIRVVAWNHDAVTKRGYVASRGEPLSWTPDGVAPGPDSGRPDLYAIVAGVSDYSSPRIKLRFPSKDAVDVANALELGAKLFNKVHLKLFASPGTDPRAIAPTKDNFRKAFEEFKAAKPMDVFVIYLAGHGVSLRTGDDTYLYLTQEARTTDSTELSNPAIRGQVAISSEELVEWIKRVPALRQVLVLDTCAAGAVVGELVKRRDMPGDIVRAVERLKDRTGFHVLLGSAADAASYEASQYGQGLLTYAMLQGMRGAALTSSGEVDVQRIFQYTADQVPLIAKSVGGIQRPEIRVPRGGESFPIGLLTKEDRERIRVNAIKPLVMQPRLLNRDAGFDDLQLEAAVEEALRDRSYGDDRTNDVAPFVYVEAHQLPDAFQPSGSYDISGDEITVTVNMVRDREPKARFTVKGSRGNVKQLSEKIADAIAAFAKSQADQN
jgi:WD40 repeat protein